jgi:hypothetical protein
MSEWQPIETAPKDGTYILLYESDQSRPVKMGCWLDSEHKRNGQVIHSAQRWSYGIIWVFGGDNPNPTHWMPIPEPPK